MPSPASPQHCAHHPAARAGWACEPCGPLCPDCVCLRPTGTGTVELCTTCNTLARTLTHHRSALPYRARLPEAFRYPLQGAGPVALLTMGAVVGGLSALGALGFLFGFALEWTILFSVLRQTARTAAGYTPPDFTDIFEDLWFPGLRAVAAAGLAWMPTFAYLHFIHDPARSAWLDPGFYPAFFFGFAYLPMALLLVATETHLIHLFNPVALVAYVRNLGEDYGRAAAFTAGCTGLDLMATGLAELLQRLPVPVLPWLLGQALVLYAPLVLVRGLGLLLYTRGDAVGYGQPRDFQVPELAEAPRGVYVPPPEAPPKVIQPIELEEPAQAIARALAEGRPSAALATYREGHLRPGDLPPEQMVSLGQRAAGESDFPLALAILDTVVLLNAASPLAAKALVVSARIHAERLGDVSAAERLYRRVLAQFPDTEAARFAASRLAPAKP